MEGYYLSQRLCVLYRRSEALCELAMQAKDFGDDPQYYEDMHQKCWQEIQKEIQDYTEAIRSAEATTTRFATDGQE